MTQKLPIISVETNIRFLKKLLAKKRILPFFKIGVDSEQRVLYAISTMKLNLLSINADAKTRKGTAFGVMTGILYLAPSNESKVINTCPKASPGCRIGCLYSAGRGAMSNVRKARIAKTVMFKNDQTQFLNITVQNIIALCKKATKANLVAATRLNGTSDVAWESVLINGKNVMEINSEHQFYDYTKRIDRIRKYAAGMMPKNYHLTFSRSENNDVEVAEALALGVNVAVVFAGNTLPATYMGRPVVDSDLHDARFLDPVGVICGLRAKGKAKRDTSGFVVKG